MCTRFICSVNKEAVLKPVFKEQGQDLTFAKTIQIAIQTEDATKVAKETAYNAKLNLFNTVNAVKPLKFKQHAEMTTWVNQRLAPDPIMLKALAQMPLVLLVDGVERKDTLAKIVISKKQFAITVLKKVIPKLYVSKGK